MEFVGEARCEQAARELCAAFDEDRVIIEAQARRLAGNEPVAMVAIGADVGLTQFRRLLASRLQAEAAPASDTHGTERPGRC